MTPWKGVRIQMKKSDKYMQTSIINEIMKQYNMRTIAEELCNQLKKSGSVSVYEVNEDGFVLRRNTDGIISSDTVINGMVKTFRTIVSDDDELQEIIQDTYDFEYDKTAINDDLLAEDVNVKLSGRLISILTSQQLQNKKHIFSFYLP